MGPEDTAEPTAVVEHEPASALLDESSATARETRVTEEPSPAVGNIPENHDRKIIPDGDSALGSFSETPQSSGAVGGGPATHDQEVADSGVRLIDSRSWSNAHLGT